MHKIVAIALREIKERFKSKLFWWLTFLGPLLLSGILIVPIGLEISAKKQIIIQIHYERPDEKLLNSVFINNENIRFMPILGDKNVIINQFKNSDYDALLDLNTEDIGQMSILYNQRIDNSSTFLHIQELVNKFYWEKFKSNELNTTQSQKWNNLAEKIKLKISDYQYLRHENTYQSFATVVALSSAIILYFFLMYYGLQMMKLISEEKQTKLLEILLTSATGTQLLVGKVLGVMIASLTQFISWLGISTIISSGIYHYFNLQMYDKNQIVNTLSLLQDKEQTMQMHYFVEAISKINFGSFTIHFFLIFVLGVLLYSLILAIAGASTQSQNDHQQLLVPITLPLFLVFLFAQNIMNEPNGLLSQIFTLIPFTSPIALLLRLPFEISTFEILRAYAILLVSNLVLFYWGGKIFKKSALSMDKKLNWFDILFK